jgi:hypothetical protein
LNIKGTSITLKNSIDKFIQDLSNEENIQSTLHGIEIPLETPLLWLSTNMAYPDMFLHIVLRKIQV